MATEKRTTTISERNYSLLTPPVMSGMKLSTKAAVMIGPLLGSLGSKVEEGGWQKVAAAVVGMDPAKVNELFMEAVSISKLHCNGEPVCGETEFEKHFGQYPGDLYPACSWALWECVKDFFPQLGGFIQAGKAAMEKAAKETASPSQEAGK